MVGIVGQMCNRIGGFSITNKIDNKLSVKVPKGSKILCLDCTLENEATLISNGTVIKTSIGFDVINQSNLTIIKSDESPLTILRGRELFYVEEVTTENNTKFILPKGSRVNQTLVPDTGEFTITSSSKYLVEY